MEASPHHKTTPLQGARILLVEDDFLIRFDLEYVLVEAGAEIVRACATVEDALRSLETDRPSAAILDVRLGQETVTPVARELSRLRIPFIFYTGQVDTDAALAEWPSCRVLAKPALPKTIVAAIAECCAGARAS